MKGVAPRRGAKRDTYHHGDLRRALLNAARAEIAASGAAALSLSSLARRAGVAQSAPYRHFADRDELLVAVAAEGFAEFTEALIAADAGTERGALERMSAAYLRFGEENVELYRLMFASGLTPRAAKDSALAKAAAASFEPLLLRLGGDSSKRARLAALAIWAQLHGFVMLKADGLVEESAEKLLSAIQLP
jgi:AcrR family transcriptional regulator